MAILTKAATSRALAIARDSEQVETFLGMPAVVVSAPMRAVMQFAERIAQSNSAVLIAGESGTGKELIARALHQFSPRSARLPSKMRIGVTPSAATESTHGRWNIAFTASPAKVMAAR